ncbi:NAD(P)/FAD-dependent oxidoreductase [Paraburkholderia sediminicola]|uniref:NAD(P)/FAD-dependent oxidoreductase n=1 Tax=Paraburkholderia sediminicola TaxID=458836 RepID=UPI0038BB7748
MALRNEHLTDDFRQAPFWWDAIVSASASIQDAPLPRQVDVVVVGAGLTGVEAARALAVAGRRVIVVDAGTPGRGASTRNAGQIGRNFKHSFGALCESVGMDLAKGYFQELRAAYDAVALLGEEAGDAIGWRTCGRVVGAMSPAHLERLHTEYSLRARQLGEEVEFLDASAVSKELGSELYHGGVRILANGAIHPGMYYEFMRARSVAAGVSIIGQTAVTGVAGQQGAFEVHTARGTIRCENVIVATNGYSGPAAPWFERRLAPINAYMIATEPLSKEAWRAVLPRSRTYHDNRRRSHFMTFSPDGSRLLFGGRTGTHPFSLMKIAAQLHADMGFIFPDLADVRISHAWTGRCAATRDLFPHVGVNPQGLHYALGYCFSGNAMGPYLGRKVAAMILGNAEEAHTLFNRDQFPAMPLPTRGPWFMPMMLNYYAWADRPKGLARAI